MVGFLAAALPSIIGGAASLLGGGPKYTPEQRWQMNFLQQNANQLRNYANSPVGSDPLEQAQFADQRAELGQQQSQQRQNLLSQYNFLGQGTNGAGDFLKNISGQQTAQNMALNAQNIMNAMQMRRQALMQSSQLAAQMPNYQPHQNGLPELFGGLAQAYASSQGGGMGGLFGGGGGKIGANNPYWSQGSGSGGVNVPLGGMGSGGQGSGGLSPTQVYNPKF